MTDELMTGLATQAFNMARCDMEQGGFTFLVATYHEGEGLHRMAKVENSIALALGTDWLDHGRTKDAAYGLLRTVVQLHPPDAVIFVSGVNSFTPTENFQKLSDAEQLELLNSNHDRHWQEVAKGNLEVCDALMVIVQNAARVCLLKQTLPDGERDVHFFDQQDFGGRMKMFGAEDDALLGLR
jgi:hypothetical protein